MNKKRDEQADTEPSGGGFDVVSWLEGMSRDTGGRPQFLEALGTQLEDVVNALRDVATRGTGEASGKVTVEFSLDLEGDKVFTTPKISAKYPARSLTKSMAFIGPGGRLVDQDPRQVAFSFTGGGISTRTEIKAPANGSRAAGAAGGGEIKAPER